MCNFYDAHYPPKKLGYIFGAKLNLPKTYNGDYKVTPTGYSPIIRVNEDGERVAEESFFKLVPDFADTMNHKYSTMNCRDDKILSSRMWRPIFEKQQRCIVPVSGFYEHHTLNEEVMIEGSKKKTNKVPYRISLKSTDVFGFAGLWNIWVDKESGREMLSHAIITTDPNETVAKIHNSSKRMATILPETAYDLWLNKVDKPEDLFDANIFKPLADEDMQFHQVNKQFDYGLSDKGLRKPVEQPIQINGEQKGLF
ncbi:SOS response-associated peptidase [Halalkalibaculum sp. DA3122]|uniref:SOS response-associated peptidase n=1 Tax=Halalkalibaculum sp. DA3122 TaxID=3373607 RepID=UPI003754296A